MLAVPSGRGLLHSAVMFGEATHFVARSEDEAMPRPF
jgi:hypothetical protein